MARTIGVILSGCGVQDGTEITEAVSVLVAIDQTGCTARCYAPPIAQKQVVDHVAGRASSSETRNVLIESARIARGKISPISDFRIDDVDAVVFPGGFGAAKNLCDFAMKGADCTVEPSIAELIRQVHKAGKPLGLACIAPVLAARVLGASGPKLTIGTDAQTAAAINTMGARHVDTAPADVCIDDENRIVTTPCYMNDVGPAVVFEGAKKMVDAVVAMLR